MDSSPMFSSFITNQLLSVKFLLLEPFPTQLTDFGSFYQTDSFQLIGGHLQYNQYRDCTIKGSYRVLSTKIPKEGQNSSFDSFSFWELVYVHIYMYIALALSIHEFLRQRPPGLGLCLRLSLYSLSPLLFRIFGSGAPLGGPHSLISKQ